MARRTSRKAGPPQMINVWWVRLVLSAVFIGLAYLFASLAIDSGSIAQYIIAIVLVYWACAHVVRGVRFAFAR